MTKSLSFSECSILKQAFLRRNPKFVFRWVSAWGCGNRCCFKKLTSWKSPTWKVSELSYLFIQPIKNYILQQYIVQYSFIICTAQGQRKPPTFPPVFTGCFGSTFPTATFQVPETTSGCRCVAPDSRPSPSWRFWASAIHNPNKPPMPCLDVPGS